MGKMLEALVSLDHALFFFVNRTGDLPWLTPFMAAFTNLHHLKVFTLGVFPLALAFWVFKRRKKGLLQILFLIVAVGTADLFSYRFVKQVTYRHRPNNHPQIHSLLKVDHGPRSSSWPSNHAMNMATMASALSFFFPQVRWFWWAFAVGIAYSRVYVGVHFPFDVLSGLVCGYLWFRLWLLIYSRVRSREELSTVEPVG